MEDIMPEGRRDVEASGKGTRDTAGKGCIHVSDEKGKGKGYFEPAMESRPRPMSEKGKGKGTLFSESRGRPFDSPGGKGKGILDYPQHGKGSEEGTRGRSSSRHAGPPPPQFQTPEASRDIQSLRQDLFHDITQNINHMVMGQRNLDREWTGGALHELESRMMDSVEDKMICMRAVMKDENKDLRMEIEELRTKHKGLAKDCWNGFEAASTSLNGLAHAIEDCQRKLDALSAGQRSVGLREIDTCARLELRNKELSDRLARVEFLLKQPSSTQNVATSSSGRSGYVIDVDVQDPSGNVEQGKASDQSSAHPGQVKRPPEESKTDKKKRKHSPANPDSVLKFLSRQSKHVASLGMDPGMLLKYIQAVLVPDFDKSWLASTYNILKGTEEGNEIPYVGLENIPHMYNLLSTFHYTSVYQEHIHRDILKPGVELGSVPIEIWHMMIWLNIKEFDKTGPVWKVPMDDHMRNIADMLFL